MTKKLAFLGYGLRSKTMLQAFREIEADISVAAVADPRWEQIKEENAGDPLFAEARYLKRGRAAGGLRTGRRIHRHALPAAYAAGGRGPEAGYPAVSGKARLHQRSAVPDAA